MSGYIREPEESSADVWIGSISTRFGTGGRLCMESGKISIYTEVRSPDEYQGFIDKLILMREEVLSRKSAA